MNSPNDRIRMIHDGWEFAIGWAQGKSHQHFADITEALSIPKHILVEAANPYAMEPLTIEFSDDPNTKEFYFFQGWTLWVVSGEIQGPGYYRYGNADVRWFKDPTTGEKLTTREALKRFFYDDSEERMAQAGLSRIGLPPKIAKIE